MNLYQRDISKKLISLRAISITLVFFCVLSFLNHSTNLGYFLSVVVLFSLFIVVKDFRVNTNTLQVKKYYLFGFLPITWAFGKINIGYEFYDSGFGKEEDPFFGDEEFWLGCLAFILTLGRANKITHISFKIYNKENRSVFKSVHILLSKEEYNRLFDFANK